MHTYKCKCSGLYLEVLQKLVNYRSWLGLSATALHRFGAKGVSAGAWQVLGLGTGHPVTLPAAETPLALGVHVSPSPAVGQTLPWHHRDPQPQSCPRVWETMAGPLHQLSKSCNIPKQCFKNQQVAFLTLLPHTGCIKQLPKISWTINSALLTVRSYGRYFAARLQTLFNKQGSQPESRQVFAKPVLGDFA